MANIGLLSPIRRFAAQRRHDPILMRNVRSAMYWTFLSRNGLTMAPESGVRVGVDAQETELGLRMTHASLKDLQRGFHQVGLRLWPV